VTFSAGDPRPFSISGCVGTAVLGLFRLGVSLGDDMDLEEVVWCITYTGEYVLVDMNCRELVNTCINIRTGQLWDRLIVGEILFPFR